MKLWCLSVRKNDQNQQSVRSRECIQVNQSEGGSHTFCFISLQCVYRERSRPRNFETSRSPTTNVNSATLKSASQKSEREREANALRQCMHRSEGTANAAIFRRTTIVFVSATCTARNFSRNLSNLPNRSMDRRFVDHGERARSTSGKSECGLVLIYATVWSRSMMAHPGALTARPRCKRVEEGGILVERSALTSAMRHLSRLCYDHLACRRAD